VRAESGGGGVPQIWRRRTALSHRGVNPALCRAGRDVCGVALAADRYARRAARGPSRHLETPTRLPKRDVASLHAALDMGAAAPAALVGAGWVAEYLGLLIANRMSWISLCIGQGCSLGMRYSLFRLCLTSLLAAAVADVLDICPG